MTDFEIAEKLAVELWGESGFECRSCESDKGYHLECRPRMFECAACSSQRSVVAGTIMEACKVPLKVWYIRARFYDEGIVPTCSQLAREAGVARSTAWLVNQKWMAAMQGKAGGEFRFTVAARRPRKPLAGEISQAMRAFWAALRLGEAAAATVCVSGDRISLGPVEDHDEHPVGQRIAERIGLVHRGVCIRWMKRWVGHYLELCETRRAWLRALLVHPPLPLVRLAPI